MLVYNVVLATSRITAISTPASIGARIYRIKRIITFHQSLVFKEQFFFFDSEFSLEHPLLFLDCCILDLACRGGGLDRFHVLDFKVGILTILLVLLDKHEIDVITLMKHLDPFPFLVFSSFLIPPLKTDLNRALDDID